MQLITEINNSTAEVCSRNVKKSNCQCVKVVPNEIKSQLM